MQYHPNDVVEPGDSYAHAATRAAGAPVGQMPGHVAYPLYGMGQAQAPAPAPMMVTQPSFWQRIKWPAIAFVAGAVAMGGVWFYVGHWMPLKKKAKGR